MKEQHKNRWLPWAAVLAALAAIAVGALWLLAPIWQPGYHPIAEKLPQPEPDGNDGPGAASPTVPDDLVDINTATAEELTALPGIGAARAAAIIAWREAHGAFTSLADLAQIEGISDRMVESWQGLATASAPPEA